MLVVVCRLVYRYQSVRRHPRKVESTRSVCYKKHIFGQVIALLLR